LTFDTVVIGAGLAGLTAALRLSDEGQKVVVLAKGVGSIQLGPATIDVLGYAPDLVESPWRALPGFLADHPDHPYAVLGRDVVSDAIAWLVERLDALDYIGGLERNLLLATPVGVLKPTAAAPRSMAAGDLRADARVTVIGLRELKDFFPAYLADNLAGDARPGISARVVEVRVPAGEADVTPLGFAQRFDDPQWRKAVIADLQGRVDERDALGFPAVLGFFDHATAWEELRDGLSGRVFEIPTLPPSIPGMRLFRAFKDALRARGARLVVGAEVRAFTGSAGRVDAVTTFAAGRTLDYRGRRVVVATGGFGAGGLEMDSRWQVREPIFGLPVTGVPPAPDERFGADVFGEHRMSRAGIAVDGGLRPVDTNGEPLFTNLHVAGAMLAGALPWREKSGDGISLASGYAAAGKVLESA
jgi:glycerol-3-phosphate dehydrogenase subunit B